MWLWHQKVWYIHDREKLLGGPSSSTLPPPTDPLGRSGCCYIPYVHRWAYMAAFIYHVASFRLNNPHGSGH